MDIRSLYQIATVILACLFAYIYLIQVSTPNLRGIQWVSLGYGSAACGTFLISERGRIPDALSLLLANMLLLLLFVGLYWGIADLLHETRRRRWLLPASLVPVFLVQAYFTYVDNQLAPRILVQSIVVAGQCLLLIALLLRNSSPRTRLARWGLIAVFSAWTGFQLARMSIVPKHQLAGVQLQDAIINPKLLLVPILAAVLAGLSFIWLAMAQLQHELELLSETDSLTGLLNRRALERAAAREIAIARRRNTSLSLIILDLDRFKALNDSHGHAAGDMALAAAATCIANGLREVDLIARFGGEEFVALLPDTSETEALQIAERLRIDLDHLKVHYLRNEIRLTASFGVTMMNRGDSSLEEILSRGDIALYQAKHNGRNQVMVS